MMEYFLLAEAVVAFLCGFFNIGQDKSEMYGVENNPAFTRNGAKDFKSPYRNQNSMG